MSKLSTRLHWLRSPGRILVVAGFAVIFLAMLPLSSEGAPAGPTISISAPGRVRVGQAINIDLTSQNVPGVAGYEVNVLFDDSVADFAGLRQRQNDVKKFGRDVGPLTAEEPGRGVAIGFYSCPFSSCGGNPGNRAAAGPSGRAHLATLSIVPKQPGPLEIRFDSLKVVDASGNPVAVNLSTASITVQVGSGGSGHAAPRGNYALAGGGARALKPLDLTRDGKVTQADVQDLAIAWQDVRERGAPCGNLPNPAADVNGDGCVDIADVQLAAATYSPATALASLATSPLTFTVNSTGDASDSNIGDGVCSSTAGGCTLRAAIQEANAHSGPDTIAFNIPGTGVHTIQLSDVLPTLSDTTGPTTINGYTQPGSAPNTDALVDNAVIQVEIKGQGPGTGNGTTGFDGLVISSANNFIRGLSLYNLRRAIMLYGSGASNNVIVGNFIGTNAAGTFGLPSRVTFASGVYIQQGAGGTQVGNTSAADRNLISGNAMNGIGTYFEGTDNANIFNNLIGLSPRGDRALPNNNQGVDINSDSSYNNIGGTGPGQRNVSSGNGGSGVELSHGTMTTENKVIGNYIGTDVNGNGGGDATQCASYYTSNKEWGVHLEDGVNNNLIANNVIGNSGLGGIKTENYDTISTQVTNNRIGIGVNGNPIPNCLFGVQVAYDSNNMLIGPANTIAYNQEGVQITTSGAVQNKVTQNSIYGNTNYQNTTPGNGRGIDIDPLDPVNPNNDPGETYWNSWSNHGINFPVISSATPYQVTGTACADSIVPKPCTIEIFVADRGSGGYGQGKRFVASGQTGGNGSFAIAVSGVNVGDWLTSTATDSQGDTSEFGANVQVTSGPVVATPTPTLAPTVGSTITLASDMFSRVITNSWGVADIGGGYAVEASSRPTYDYNVNGSAGTMSVSASNLWHSAYLPGVSGQDVDVTFRVKTDKVDTTGYQFVYFSARRVAAGTQYLGRVAFTPSAGVLLQAGKSISENVTLFGGEITVSGLAHQADSYIWVHGQLRGTNPTTIRMRAWADGQAEPTAWQYSVTDSEPALQSPGAVGLRTLVSSGASSLPDLFSFDNYTVTSPSGSVSTPVPTPTNTPTATPVSSTPTPTPVSSTPTPTPSTTTYASDSFSRIVSNGWGSADIGGAYTLYGTSSDFQVNGSAGTINMGTPNVTRSAYLGISAQDIDESFRVATNKLPAGGGAIVYLIGRRVSAGNDYLARIRFPSGGGVYVQGSKEVNGSFTNLGGEVLVSGLSLSTNTFIRLRAQMVGVNPTVIRIRAWLDGQTEPTTWQYSVQDSEAVLQQAGGVGIRGYISGSLTNAPLLFTYDSFLVTSSSSSNILLSTIQESSPMASPSEAEPLLGKLNAGAQATPNVGTLP